MKFDLPPRDCLFSKRSHYASFMGVIGRLFGFTPIFISKLLISRDLYPNATISALPVASAGDITSAAICHIHSSQAISSDLTNHKGISIN